MASLPLPAPPTAPTVRERPHAHVSVRRRWADPWVPVPYLQAVACADAARPGMPWATFRWAAGEVKWEDETAFSTRDPIDLKDWFVRVEVTATSAETVASTLWVGRICDEAMDVLGGDAGPAGDQDLTALGLAFELDRAVVDGSLVGSGSDPAVAVKVDTPLVFNGPKRRGAGEFGNRGASTPSYDGPDGAAHATHVFLADGSPDVAPWTVHDVIVNLLAGFGPADVRFSVGGQLDAIRDLAAPRLAAVGRSLLELFDALLDRRRGLGWCVRYAEGGTRAAEVHVFTLDGTATVLDAGVTLPAAAEQADLAVDDFKREVAEHRLALDTMARYDAVEVVGERVLVCFSVSSRDENLVPGWAGAEATAYKTATGDDADPVKNDEFRKADRFHPVYAHFHIPRSWDWTAGGGDGGPKKLVNVAVQAPGYFSPGHATAAPVRTWGHRVERWIPVRRTDGPPGSDAEYREPAVFVRDETSPDESRHRWMPADKTTEGLRQADVRPLDRDFGVEVKFRPAHYLAKTDWQKAKASMVPPRFSYGKLIATVAARTDERLRVTFKVGGGVPPASPRRLLIEVADCELWWVAPMTVLDVDADGGLVRETRSGQDLVVRNDLRRLRHVGLLAQAWYGKARASLRVTFREMHRQFTVGLYVRQVSDAWRHEPVNSAVTRVTWDLRAMTTTVETQYSEFGAAGSVVAS